MSGLCSVTVKQTNKQAQAREVNALICENSDGFWKRLNPIPNPVIYNEENRRG